MASATRRSALTAEKSVDEMKEARDQETAPYIVAHFEIPIGSYIENWVDSILAKLREFDSIWLIGEMDSRLQGIDLEKLQRRAMQMSGQFLLLLADRPTHIKDDLVDCLSNLCVTLNELGRVRFDMDGGSSVNVFNAQGDNVIEQINIAFALIDKTSQSSPMESPQDE